MIAGDQRRGTIPSPSKCANSDQEAQLEALSKLTQNQTQDNGDQRPASEEGGDKKEISSTKATSCANQTEKEPFDKPIELRLLVRRREAGALIGKKGSNIKRLRETYRDSASFSIPDTGNGPERVVSIVSRSWSKSMEPILNELTRLLLVKSPTTSAEEQIELKMLIHSLHAGSIIGLGGQTIKKLRVVSIDRRVIVEKTSGSNEKGKDNHLLLSMKLQPSPTHSTNTLCYR